MDQQTIELLTFLLRLYRVLNHQGTYRMPIEIKGLKGDALRARQNIDALKKAYAGFNEAAPKHVADVSSLTSQVENLSSDLEFAANVLGNSVESSEETKEAAGSEGSSVSFLKTAGNNSS